MNDEEVLEQPIFDTQERAQEILHEAAHELQALVGDLVRQPGERDAAWKHRTTLEDRRLVVQIRSAAAVLQDLEQVIIPSWADL